MWKPVRLQGVGAASSIVNANTNPAGKLDTWRAKVNCLFGLGLNGSPTTWDPKCGSAWTGWNATAINPQVDRIPTEAVVGWDATQNGNMAELLQEPSLMGALEGAAITVLSKGVNFPTDPWAPAAGAFPVGTPLLTSTTNANTGCGANTANAKNQFPSNFLCNPSSIDGLGITNSSQGGGGIFVHAWGHDLQIANNRVYNNSGTLTGGITVGQGEFPPAYFGGGAALTVANLDPGSCLSSNTLNLQLPYCLDMNVNVHHNAVTQNSSTGDELFSATPAGAGGVSFCTGADFYKFNYNWVCGNLSTGDGGGVGHLGMIYQGDIEHNSIIFNQSTNPTIATNGGGLLIMGAPDADPVCGTTTDQDCVSAPGAITPSDGAGPGLVINANLIMGNGADSGSGGGLRLQNINGSEVVAFPNGSGTINNAVNYPALGGSTVPRANGTKSAWYDVSVTNNIITNNVAGWDGAGISMVDALNVNIINNTIMKNDTTASSGVLFNTLGAPLASSQGPCPTSPITGMPANPCVTTSTPQPAGLVSIQNSAVLTANLPSTVKVTCPAGHFAGNTALNGTCRTFSYPLLANDLFYQNRAFNIQVGALGGGTLNQQHTVTLTPAFNQTATGACVTSTNYWDIGVRGDTGPTNHNGSGTANLLNPTYSIIGTGGYTGTGDITTNPAVVSPYCNGSRIPPEFGGTGYQVPPGISDATVPNPLFNLTPAATVDEGNNWINISWGPLAMTNPATNAVLGNYAPASVTSPVVNHIPSTATANYAEAPPLDFFNKLRKTNGAVDAGAVEFVAVVSATLTTTSHNYGGVTRACPGTWGQKTACALDPAQVFTLTNTGNVTLTAIAQGVLGGTNATEFSIARDLSTCGPNGGGQIHGPNTTLAPGGTCVITVQFKPLTAQSTGSKTATISVTDLAGTQTSTLTGTAN
jgi:hypothetical protein